MTTIDPPRAVRVKTSTGWADLALMGPPGPPGPQGPVGPQGPPTTNYVPVDGSGNALMPGPAVWNGDTNLYRAAAGYLRTDTSLLAGAAIISYVDVGRVTLTVGPSNEPWITFGAEGDTNLYRASAANLKTDGSFSAGQSVVVDASNGSNRLYLGGALDAYLYRAAAGTLKTDGAFQVGTLGSGPFAVGAADSGGAGYRMVRVPN